MQAQAVYAAVMEAGRWVQTLLLPMQSDEELFASALTLGAVEHHLSDMAQALSQAPPDLHRNLPNMDWSGWAALHRLLLEDVQPRRDAVWYAVSALVPQSMELLASVRRRQPALFARPGSPGRSGPWRPT